MDDSVNQQPVKNICYEVLIRLNEDATCPVDLAFMLFKDASSEQCDKITGAISRLRRNGWSIGPRSYRLGPEHSGLARALEALGRWSSSVSLTPEAVAQVFRCREKVHSWRT